MNQAPWIHVDLDLETLRVPDLRAFAIALASSAQSPSDFPNVTTLRHANKPTLLDLLCCTEPPTAVERAGRPSLPPRLLPRLRDPRKRRRPLPVGMPGEGES